MNRRYTKRRSERMIVPCDLVFRSATKKLAKPGQMRRRRVHNLIDRSCAHERLKQTDVVSSSL